MPIRKTNSNVDETAAATRVATPNSRTTARHSSSTGRP